MTDDHDGPQDTESRDERVTEEMPDGVSQGELMMVNTLHIKEDSWVNYLAALNEILPQARALDACLLLEAGHVIDRPVTVMLVERWRSGVEYVTSVLQLPMYQKYLELTESMYASPRSVMVLDAL